MLEKERKKRKHKRELNSLRNKMGKNIIWFDSLSIKKQYDVLFLWKHEKRFNKIIEPKKISTRWGDVIFYPPKLKHFVYDLRKKSIFKIEKHSLRESVIDLILNKKK